MTEVLLDEKQAAAFLKLKVHTMQVWRLKGYGPPHLRLSARAVRYRESDLNAWLQTRTRQSTSDVGAPVGDSDAATVQ